MANMPSVSSSSDSETFWKERGEIRHWQVGFMWTIKQATAADCPSVFQTGLPTVSQTEYPRDHSAASSLRGIHRLPEDYLCSVNWRGPMLPHLACPSHDMRTSSRSRHMPSHKTFCELVQTLPFFLQNWSLASSIMNGVPNLKYLSPTLSRLKSVFCILNSMELLFWEECLKSSLLIIIR